MNLKMFTPKTTQTSFHTSFFGKYLQFAVRQFSRRCNFSWQLQTLFKVSKNRNVDDKFTIPVEAQESRQLGEKFENTWNRDKNPSLLKTLVKMFGLEFALCGLIYSIPELLST